MYLKMGERISFLRVSRGLSREKLAEEVNISPKFLYEIETGKKGFSVRILYDLCEALDVTSEYLINGEE
ncbi:MAG: helix-turn-helix domain-containing protein [Lachnospiraceae bacterium]|nr:helix-turn-helix domain-containing protein [Lachnospiraceae bacterium]